MTTWRTLLSPINDTVTIPWLGGRGLYSKDRKWTIKGTLPEEYGWYTFDVDGGTNARNPTLAVVLPELLDNDVVGYLVGNRIIVDGARCEPDPKTICQYAESVYLLDEGLDRFSRVRAGRIYRNGPLMFKCQDMPLGPEDAVNEAYCDQLPSVNHIKNVSPALDAAFRMETFQRAETARRRAEAEAFRIAEELRIAKEARRAELVERLGDGAGRREMALHDFATAARAALAVGGAEYLDHRLVRRGEWAVKYRLNGARYECTCDERLAILDAGVCLNGHDGERGDTYFTLESLPAVILQAIRENVLVVFRHV